MSVEAAKLTPAKPTTLAQTPALLDKEVLADRLLGVLRLAGEHVARLPEYSSVWGDAEDPFVRLADKIVVESALLALVASRHAGTGQRVQDAVEVLAQALEPHARSERNQVLLLRYPHTAMSLGIAHVALSCVGFRDPTFDALLSDALSSGHADATERLPYRAMERRWLSKLVDPEAAVSFDDLLPLSIVARPAHPIYMLATDIYALTHVPMFVTDFGTMAPPKACDVTQMCASIDAALAWALFTDNFDLLAELVLARELLDVPWSSYQQLAWAALECAWDDLGFLACPSFEVKAFDKLKPEERSPYAFRHIYHTTYVGGMLCALLLRPQRQDLIEATQTPTHDPGLPAACQAAIGAATAFCAREPDREPGNISRDEEGSKTQNATGLLERTQPTDLDDVVKLVEQWHDRDVNATRTPLRVLGRSGLPERDLVPVLLDGLLAAAARAYDLVMLAHILEVAARRNGPLTPTTHVATRFLLRQQLPSGAIGGWFVTPANTESPHACKVTAGLARALVAIVDRLAETAAS